MSVIRRGIQHVKKTQTSRGEKRSNVRNGQHSEWDKSRLNTAKEKLGHRAVKITQNETQKDKRLRGK